VRHGHWPRLGLQARALNVVSLRKTIAGFSRADALAVAFLTVLTAALLLWAARTPLRLVSGDWPTQWFPFYAFLGERLRTGDLPGWNPHQFSGMPFAANPASGWAYWPGMLCYTLLPAEPATVAFIGFHLLLAGIATYLLARALSLSVGGSVVAGTVFLAVWTLLAIDQFPFIAVLTAWLPLSLLGVEIALRSRLPAARLAGWTAAGIAVSQMLGTWLGQGAYYGLLFLGAWLAFRTLIAPPHPQPFPRRVVTLLGNGAAMTAIGLALAAAGLVPRLEFNPRTNIPRGIYDTALAIVEDDVTWSPGVAILHLTGGLNGSRMIAGAAAVGLALLALVVARRWFAMPFFAITVVVTYVLALDRHTPLHGLFFTLVPQFEAIHLHRSTRILMLAGLPIALLAGAAVSFLWHTSSERSQNGAIPFHHQLPPKSLSRRDGRGVGVRAGSTGHVPPIPAYQPQASGRNVLAAVAGALLAIGSVILSILLTPDQPLLRLPLISLVAVGLLVAIAALTPSPATRVLLPTALIAVVLWQPVAQLRARELGPDPARWGALYRSVGSEVPTFLYQNEAATFLRERGPASRYVGYDPALLPPPETGINAYRNSANEPGQAWLLVDNWATWFGIDSAQGYSPILVRRYVEVVNAINGHRQEYHGTNVFPDGIASPLLDLLSIRHIVVPADARRRDDLAELTASLPTAYRDEHVRILERASALPRAWLVHDARQVAPGDAVSLLADGAIDPSRTVLLEAPPPVLAPAAADAVEEVAWVRSEPDRLELAVTASAPALLVLSDVWDPGWSAAVDGSPAPVLLASHAFRAVPVPAGEHRLTLHYAPSSLRAGVAVTLVTSIALALAFVVLGRQMPAQPADSRR
jgi:hypothetical protein